MKVFVKLFSLCAMLALCSACLIIIKSPTGASANSGISWGAPIKIGNNPNSKEIVLESFYAINVGNALTVRYFTSQSTPKMVVYSPKGYKDNFAYYIKDEVLYLYRSDDNSKLEIVVELYNANLNSIYTHGAAKFTSTTTLTTNNLYIQQSGASDIKLANCKFSDLKLTLSGASDFEAKSIVGNNLIVRVSGASEAELNNVSLSGNAKFSISGASEVEAEFNNANMLNIKASGASKFEGKGKVNSLSVISSGASKISTTGLKVKE